MRKLIVVTTLSLGLGLSPAAFAAGGPPPCGGKGQPACNQPQGGPGQQHGPQGQPQQGHNGGQPGSQQGHNQPAPQPHGGGNQHQPPGNQAHHGPKPGDKLPPGGRGHPVPQSAYQRNHLPPPPHGQQWVQVDGQFILISIATGVIFSVLAGSR
ncbi:RcnB family protein [Martelella endophytica]|uniref:Integral membrane protein n=1 Tax=Martelella endophytica TaxID=1486262 RepID=A0A0D5LQP0_MAREN|nr:RcnB family protein [Martelella endophytica]AJY46426.1 hypothetical protein TM49_13280 [Martelella endophytica]